MVHAELHDIDRRAPSAARRYTLLDANAEMIVSETPGRFGGNRGLRIYGRLDCPSALRALAKGYARHRVFFADEATAVAAGYRPCGSCMRHAYAHWKSTHVKRPAATRTHRADE